MDVLLLHGFGETADVWTPFLPLLPTSGYRYHTLDYSAITFCQSMDEYADWLHHEVKERKITRFVLIGHSMGGYISLAYARKHPNYLAGLGLFHSSAFADTPERQEARLKTAKFLEKNGTAEFIKDFLPKMYNEAFRKRNQVLIQQHLKDNQEIPADALITATLAMRERADTTAVLASLEIPTLLIIGKADEFVPYEVSLKHVALCRQPHVLILSEIAHAAMHEAPEAAAAITAEFLAACQ